MLFSCWTGILSYLCFLYSSLNTSLFLGYMVSLKESICIHEYAVIYLNICWSGKQVTLITKCKMLRRVNPEL